MIGVPGNYGSSLEAPSTSVVRLSTTMNPPITSSRGYATDSVPHEHIVLS